ncbi:lytic transglycosylase domain-containing protein [Porphyrobacter sp. GA68]|uniref:lytic transglycosylase domain-containing protein n=1 Tax=Porphyrobacter sp. GA68 TaxID=2883480 RepID=UPI001D18CF45|nr:lytic transglycosylase domain-containing protein [Porphyrobacter sp. GA68]
MSLKQEVRVGFAAAVALWAVPAEADVLEIGGEGTRWIAGGVVASAVVDAAAPEDEQFLLLADDAAEGDANLSGRYVPALYAAKVAELSRRFDLSPALIEALVWQESRWRHAAVSPKGARGLGQLMPGTARELGVDPDDPFANLEGAARYLRAQLDRFDGDVERALAAYNAGPGRVERANGIPAIAETKNYVAAIMGRLSNHSRE